MNLIRAACAAAIVCMVPPASAEIRGFNPDTVRDAIGRIAPSPTAELSAVARARVARLDRTAQALRLNLANDPVALLAALDDDERRIAVDALASGTVDGWRYFFAGAVVLVGGIESQTVRVGYYNALVDGFILADLQDTGGSFRLAAMQARSGDTLRGEPGPAGANPAWMRTEGIPAPVAMVEAAAAASRGFALANPPLATALPTLVSGSEQVVGERATTSVAMIATVVASPAWSGALAPIDPRLLPGLGTERHAAVAALPEAARQDLRLAGLLRRAGGSTAAFHSPATPRLILFVDVAEPADAPPALGSAALVDILAAEGADR
ncbi:MAG: hypothetical protein ACK4QW_08610 [Alphaproteobacteria bacterium]